MIKKIFLVGNPNVGKSVVFSRITGVKVISSNYPGTTIGIARGFLKKGEEKIEVVDLPGTYSLEPHTKAEEVVASALQENAKEEIIVLNVIDATNLERNLFLTLQLVEKGFAVIVCLNMCDDIVHRGIHIDTERLRGLLGVPVISTCAVTGAGIKMLVEDLSQAQPRPVDERTHEQRWKEIGQIVEQTQSLTHRHHTFREILEDASIRPLSGFMISAAVIYASFKIVRFIGDFLINKVFDPFFMNIYRPVLENLSAILGKEGFLHHLLIGEIIAGEINFEQSLGILTTAPYIEFAIVLPYVLSFYFVLSLLEDIGYLPRLAILLDNLFHRLGLHGFAIIPVLLGFGCNVPGILSTRVLESRRERFIAATLISIGIPCVPLQAMIFGLLGRYSGFYVAGVYLVLSSLIIIIGMVMNRALKGYSPELMLEIPGYRFPPLAVLFRKLYMRIKGFLIEAVPVVLIGVGVINILMFFNVFVLFTSFFAPVIKGLFGLPEETIVALAVGFLRKDVAVGLLIPLQLSIKQLFIAATLLSISFPCIATFVILFKELGLKDLLKSIAIMITVTVVVGTLLNWTIIR